MRIIPASLLLLFSLSAGVVASGRLSNRVALAAASSTLDRPSDPVVLTGADVPWLLGVDPADLVAFRYDGGWQQIPVQVDERAVKDFAEVYNVGSGGGGAERGGPAGLAYPKPTGVTELLYTDGGTFTGPDPDGTLDEDDEIAVMARDAGGEPPSFSEPSGVISDSGVKLTVSDPLDPPAEGYIYVFESNGSLSPGAGQQYVSYTFDLGSGDYLTTYNTLYGPNPEDSLVTTPYYAHHFAERWTSDEIKITAGAASGVDILDRHKNLFFPGYCGRSEDTFAAGEGAFVANKSGPVRTIRSYVGANSGPLTQRDHIFYERREDIRTYLRVHTIPGVMDFFDYSPSASGMTYYDDLNTSGVTIDGDPDSVAAGPFSWEMVTGPQGSLVIVGDVSTNIEGFAYTLYYLDDSTPSEMQCTGDEFAYGSSGLWVNQYIPNTDPSRGATDFLHATRTLYYEPPGLAVAGAERLHDQALAPLTYATAPYVSGPPVGGMAELPEAGGGAFAEAGRLGGGNGSTIWAGAAGALAVLLMGAAVLCIRGRRPLHR